MFVCICGCKRHVYAYERMLMCVRKGIHVYIHAWMHAHIQDSAIFVYWNVGTRTCLLVSCFLQQEIKSATAHGQCLLSVSCLMSVSDSRQNLCLVSVSRLMSVSCLMSVSDSRQTLCLVSRVCLRLSANPLSRVCLVSVSDSRQTLSAREGRALDGRR